MIDLNVRINVDTSRLRERAEAATREAQSILDQQVLKDSNYYIPFRDGFLRSSSLFHSQIGEGKLEWVTPYARKVYYGTSILFRKEVNPQASALWFEKAKASRKKDWLQMVRTVYRSLFNGN